MATYIMLGTFTDQGIRNIKDTAKRVETFRAATKGTGVTIKEAYWTLGQFDVFTVWEAPDDATMTAMALSVGKLGNVRTQVLPAFNEAEIGKILGKMI
jgi:uncharacterized protein with GYD domain